MRITFFLKLTLALAFLWLVEIPLAPDEAQYWTWSNHLGFGYYSKPPGIAWQIFATTSIFGDTEFGIRSSAILMGCAHLLAIYWLGLQANLSKRAALLAAIAFSFAPLGMLGSLLATTDGGYILFWTLALGCYLRGSHLAVVGALVALGGLWKWTALVLWLFILFDQYKSSNPRWAQAFAGIALTLLTFLPSLYWNATHDWATFRHVWGNMTGSQEHAADGNPIEFLGAQVGLLSPILFALFALGVKATFQFKAPRGVRFSSALSLATLVAYTLFAIKTKMQGNWAVFLFPTACVTLGWYVDNTWRKTRNWFAAGVATSVALCILLGFIPSFQKRDISILGFKPNYKLNPFRHNMGWDKIGEALEVEGYNADKHFLIADTYQLASVLSFYGPGQKQGYFFNLFGRRKNQFSYWPAPNHLGQTAYLVAAENAPRFPDDPKEWANRYIQALLPYFNTVELANSYTLFECYNTKGKQALIIRCNGYKGGIPTDPEVY